MELQNKAAKEKQRRQELWEYLAGRVDKAAVEQIVAEILFMEQQLEQLKQLPFIMVHPENPEIQKQTPAARTYISMAAQYNSYIRTVLRMAGEDAAEEESPLRAWVKSQK